jgi:hypothetical protein
MTTAQTLNQFIGFMKTDQPVSFEQTMHIIEKYYQFKPIAFRNGLGDEMIINQAGENSGSCKIFAFARLHSLSQNQTLSLFGDYYYKEVLNDPDGSGHANIRSFMKHGWEGIKMPDNPLKLRD